MYIPCQFYTHTHTHIRKEKVNVQSNLIYGLGIHIKQPIDTWGKRKKKKNDVKRI